MSDDILKSAGLPDELWESIARETQKITVRTERRRWGKKMTIVEGFDNSVDGDKIAKTLKKKLACGGTFKEGHVELQGDHRSRVRDILAKMGFPGDSIEVK